MEIFKSSKVNCYLKLSKLFPLEDVCKQINFSSQMLINSFNKKLFFWTLSLGVLYVQIKCFSTVLYTQDGFLLPGFLVIE